jgi:hypothetical protein
MRSRARLTLAGLVLWLCSVPVPAQDVSPPSRPEASDQQRTTGLPPPVSWEFNFDAGVGTFGFGNSLYINPKDPGTNEDLSDQWFEGYVKPSLSGVYKMPSGSQLYGRVSVVGERTYGEVPELYGHDVSSFGPEDGYVGWRSGTSLSSSENLIDISVGREAFQLGHGFLLWDGASEGGSRGGYWTNARKAFQFATIAKFRPGPNTIETFYLDKDELPENDSGTRLWGLNYEFRTGKDDSTELGATYLRFRAKPGVHPGRDGLNVFDVRAFTAPLAAAPDVSFGFEYAAERNGEVLHSNAWTAEGSYRFSEARWKPQLTYRYASFQGDNPSTTADENWDTLLPGFYDWGYWWQGEIAGEYFLSNSNLKSHLVRAHVAPNESISGGLLFFRFDLDRPTAFGPQVTSSKVAVEVDAYSDWKLNSNFTVSLVGAFADPGKAVQQYTGRTRNFAYAMAYIGYSY